MTPAAAVHGSAGRRWLGLAGWLIVAFLPSLVGTLATDPAFYEGLERPEWAPPASLFGPVWTVLYALIGVSAWLVWERYGFTQARGALILFLVQHVLNAAWSWIFFGLQLPGVAFAEIVLLWLLIIGTVAAFHRLRPVAAYLLVPYFLWVTYAAALNLALWRMNA